VVAVLGANVIADLWRDLRLGTNSFREIGGATAPLMLLAARRFPHGYRRAALDHNLNSLRRLRRENILTAVSNFSSNQSVAVFSSSQGWRLCKLG
jgi:hypothetical protein